MVKLADKILISSQDYLEHSDLKKYWLKNKDKFIISPFGVDQQKFYPQDKNQQLIERYGLKQENKIVLSVGGLDKAHYFKGVKLLIQATTDLKEQMPNLRLLIVGDGDLKSNYEKLSHDLGVQDKVIFAGRIEDDDLSDYYNLADVFIFPSFTRSEAFGLVSLEAMACAKPIIVSDLPGVRTLAENNGLIVKTNNIRDLSEKIYSIFQDKNKLKEMGIFSLRNVQEKYYWPDIVRQLEEIYVQAINPNN
jgi:glycosyltransferase involved in cell wall biosynthesis